MPRRTKEAEVSTDAETPVAETQSDPVAGGSQTEPNGESTNGEEKPKRSTVDDLPLGPTQTRTGAAATVIEGPKGKRVFTAGGDKGAKIAELLKTKPNMSRKEIAGIVGCSQSRVAEVARVLGLASARQASAGPSEDAGTQPESAPPPPTEEAPPAQAPEPAPESVST